MSVIILIDFEIEPPSFVLTTSLQPQSQYGNPFNYAVIVSYISNIQLDTNYFRFVHNGTYSTI